VLTDPLTRDVQEQRVRTEVTCRRRRCCCGWQARLDETNAKLRDLQKAARGLTQLQRLKAAADETCTRLRTEVLGIKQQKVALARQIERSQRDFAEHR